MRFVLLCSVSLALEDKQAHPLHRPNSVPHHKPQWLKGITCCMLHVCHVHKFPLFCWEPARRKKKHFKLVKYLPATYFLYIFMFTCLCCYTCSTTLSLVINRYTQLPGRQSMGRTQFSTAQGFQFTQLSLPVDNKWNTSLLCHSVRALSGMCIYTPCLCSLAGQAGSPTPHSPSAQLSATSQRSHRERYHILCLYCATS